MEISVVLVNYRVARYLMLALRTLEEAAYFFAQRYRHEGTTHSAHTGELPYRPTNAGSLPFPADLVEVWVVDNASGDGSETLITQKFPWVKWIQNAENVGFARANNQALRKSSGKYYVLQNPDTVLSEDLLWRCWSAMQHDLAVGGLGVHMVDGRGSFLKESKRGLPTPEAAWWKMTGFSALFPRHPRFAAYHQGHLKSSENHYVPILAGAYMWVRASAAAEIGLLDESYFMYGEDIDWSYRIVRAGYRNLYLADGRLIHFKGESTQKESLRYVSLFYGAMIQFAKRYYGKSKSLWLHGLLQAGILGRGFFSVMRRISGWLLHPVLDWLGYTVVLWWVTDYWEATVKAGEGLVYPDFFRNQVVPAYALIWVLLALFYGAYERPYRPGRVVGGLAMGLLLTGFVYGFLPMEWRFSRGILLAGAVSCLAFSLLWKGLIHRVFQGNQGMLEAEEPRKVLGAGTLETMHQTALLYRTLPHARFLGQVTYGRPTGASSSPAASVSQPPLLGNWDDLPLLVHSLKPDEVVYDTGAIPVSSIITSMKEVGQHVRNIKFTESGFPFLVGAGEVLEARSSAAEAYQGYPSEQFRRNLRRIDLCMALPALFIQIFAFPWLEPSVRRQHMAWMLVTGRVHWMGFGRCRDRQLLDLSELPEAYSLRQTQASRIWFENYALQADFQVMLRDALRLMPGLLKRAPR